jgi:hypothetical protein
MFVKEPGVPKDVGEATVGGAPKDTPESPNGPKGSDTEGEFTGLTDPLRKSPGIEQE